MRLLEALPVLDLLRACRKLGDYWGLGPEVMANLLATLAVGILKAMWARHDLKESGGAGCGENPAASRSGASRGAVQPDRAALTCLCVSARRQENRVRPTHQI